MPLRGLLKPYQTKNRVFSIKILCLGWFRLGFELLPEVFTLSELQGAYEIVLGEELDKRNFRRKILSAGVIEPSGSLRAGEGRPAQLYRYRDDAVAEVKARRLFP